MQVNGNIIKRYRDYFLREQILLNIRVEHLDSDCSRIFVIAMLLEFSECMEQDTNFLLLDGGRCAMDFTP